MKWVLAAATAAAIVTASGGAFAQECKGGYRMLPNNIPVPCEGNVYATPEARVYERAPIITGSIGGPYVQRRVYRPHYAYPYYADAYPYYYDGPYHRRHHSYGPYASSFSFGIGVGIGGCWVGDRWVDGYC